MRVVGNVAGFIPSEHLDFDPVIDDGERAELEGYHAEEAEEMAALHVAGETPNGNDLGTHHGADG